MAKQPFVSHTVNGYSRYDLPESKAFTCTPGLIYPARIDFINPRDRVTISQGIDVRSNPLAVPTFNPYTVRLHRFWVPLQLYHPELRTNSSKFDMNSLSLNWIPRCYEETKVGNKSVFHHRRAFANSLFPWLRVSPNTFAVGNYYDVELPTDANPSHWSNADTYLAYWDIVRNYYSFSQWGLYSYAWPAAWGLSYNNNASPYYNIVSAQSNTYFAAMLGNLEFLDAYYESQFYPSAVPSSNNTYNRSNLFRQIVNSNIAVGYGRDGDGYPVASIPDQAPIGSGSPLDQTSTTNLSGGEAYSLQAYFCVAHPLAVAPASPDRFSRLLPGTSSSNVGISGISTIPQLAVASRLQEYKDLLGAGGSRFSDWLETFFASKISHVDRPLLLFSASQTVNVQVVMNQSGSNNFGEGQPLGQQGGAIAFNSVLGRSQSYYFKEPGYMIDMLTIRPVYYWTGIIPDYSNWQGADYFNPIYNDIGYQPVSFLNFGETSNTQPLTQAYEPCYNEFRASYDETLGSFNPFRYASGSNAPLYSYWVQQRRSSNSLGRLYPVHTFLFCDIQTVNSPFASNVEDNFFVNLSYSVRKKSLVNKTFATRLSNR